MTVLRGCIRQRLLSITRTRYLFNGRPHEIGHGDVELRFEAGPSVVLSLAPDGESVTAGPGPLKVPPAFELHEGAHCAWETIHVSDAEPFNRLVGAVLSSVGAIVDRWKEGGHEALSGWALRFGDQLLTFANQGDESRLALDLPPADSRLMTFIEDVGGARGAG
ncbi:MAG: hypothetical protein ABUT39_29085 [Acidobacteriota bacterium]